MTSYVYEQDTGKFFDPDGTFLVKGYSGQPSAKNDASKEHIRSVGPIPRGRWSIGSAYNSKAVGAAAIPLTPIGHDAHGRTAFRIHGDSVKAPGTASHGCIILPRAIRDIIIRGAIKTLIVKLSTDNI